MIINGGNYQGGTYLDKELILPTNGLKLYLDSGNLASYPGEGSIWYDLSGEGYDTTINAGMSYYTSAGGIFAFDGSESGYAQVPSGFGYDYSAGVTVNVWANFAPTFTAWTRLIDFGNGDPLNNIIIGRRSTTNMYFMSIEGINSDNMIPGEPAIDFGNWAMYTMFANGTFWKLYKNGVFQSYEANAGLPAIVTRTANYIGKSNWVADDFFVGSMSVVQLYNRALSESEITNCFDYFKGRYGL